MKTNRETEMGQRERGANDRQKLPIDVLESLWLYETRTGHDIRSIARREGLGERRIQVGVMRAKLREIAKTRGSGTGDQPVRFDARSLPRLVPLFPIGPFTPNSVCGHRHPIRAGSIFCCMVCHASGVDDHPGLNRDPRTEPTPEPKTKPTMPPSSQVASSDRSTARPHRRMKQFERKGIIPPVKA